MLARSFLAFGFVVLAYASSAAQPALPDEQVYTLYRDSDGSGVLKTPIATFDSYECRVFNREKCMLARDLFQQQPVVKFNFWCEPGRFHP